MAYKIIRVLRFVSIVASALVGAREVRGMYSKRKGVWSVLRRLVRQIG